MILILLALGALVGLGMLVAGVYRKSSSRQQGGGGLIIAGGTLLLGCAGFIAFILFVFASGM